MSLNIKPQTIYQWQIEYLTATGNSQILDRFDNGREQSSKLVDPTSVIRVSLLPSIPILPQHDIFINSDKGESFVRWFGRTMMKMDRGIVHYLNCVQTTHYRVWVHNDGRVWITNPNEEIYL